MVAVDLKLLVESVVVLMDLLELLDLHSKVDKVPQVAVVDTSVVEVVNMWKDVVLMVPVAVDQDIFHQLISKRVHLVETAQQVAAVEMDHSRLIEYQFPNRS
jgi:hypothetical protein